MVKEKKTIPITDKFKIDIAIIYTCTRYRAGCSPSAVAVTNRARWRWSVGEGGHPVIFFHF